MAKEGLKEAKKAVGRPVLSIDEKIAEAERQLSEKRESLSKLKELKRAQEAEKLERNRKAIVEQLKSLGLDVVDAEKWREVGPKLQALFGVEPQSVSAGTPAEKRSDGTTAAEAAA
jgi:hypothetical protein